MPSFNTRQISSPAVLAAERRRIDRAFSDFVREQYFVQRVMTNINLAMSVRVGIATEWLRTKIVYNISRPVTKRLTARTVMSVTGASQTAYFTEISNRSKPGEFPKADTTLLMKSIFGEVRNPFIGIYDGYVGTPVDYAVPLELKMNRSFLKRTLLEEKATIVAILASPIQDREVL